MANRVRSYFPKGGHSETKTETMTPKQTTEIHVITTALERSATNSWMGA